MLVLDYEDLLAWSRAAEARRRRREQHQEAAESVLGAADQELLEKARNDEDLEIAGEGTEASAAVQGIVKTGENEKLDMGQVCMEAVGPSGQGFIAVRGVRGYDSLRGRLLPLARKLALMPNVRRLAVLKEHGLGTDVSLKAPDRPVSSFAAQLRFGSMSEFAKSKQSDPVTENRRHDPPSVGKGGVVKSNVHEEEDHSLRDLGSLFHQLGACMVDVGLLVAQLCDSTGHYGSLRSAGLKQAIQESGTAKGRLIHYHSLEEQAMLYSRLMPREGKKQQRSLNAIGNKEGPSPLLVEATQEQSSVTNLWQQWHCDYGVFTVLTAPLFLKAFPVPRGAAALEHTCRISRTSECCNTPTNRFSTIERSLKTRPQCVSQCGAHVSIDNESAPKHAHFEQLSLNCLKPGDVDEESVYERRFSVHNCPSPEGNSGLQVMDADGQATSVVVPSEYLIVQVGEAAQILSGGELVARTHCVARPSMNKDVSRETMAVFLQPAWDRTLDPPCSNTEKVKALEARGLMTDMETHIPPLNLRWREGCTFAEFSRETTRQYYGGDGRQQRR